MLLSGGISPYTSQCLAEMSKAEDGMLFSGCISFHTSQLLASQTLRTGCCFQVAFHFHLFGSWRKEYHKAKDGTLFSGSILPKGVSKAVKDEILFSCADK